ncbi:nucleoprotein [CAS virus]|uniref:Nucleoprotein n=1 Tax=CAS virus TaxID=1223561 RepID=J7HCF9_9VIRU|nr:nucleoprotein [CAS virus]AFP93552.1 nucleoprotein [CAS virus]AKH49229.1 nucleoprotein [unidentified Reptarenavirus]AKH49231.1 nucleoprotein [unidentified Reptarenavirus]AKH49233.1 nucleoprotein [unidentified Reptarenavirus]
MNQLVVKKHLNKVLRPFQANLNNDLFKDVKLISAKININEVNDVLRRLRKETKTRDDLQKLRKLNKYLAEGTNVTSEQVVVEIDSTQMSDEDLMQCIDNLERIKKKAEYKGGRDKPSSKFEFETGLSHEDHERFSSLFASFVPQKPNPRNENNKPKSWIGVSSEELANQFGTSPSITVSIMLQRSGCTFKELFEALNDISLLDAGMFVNASVIKALSSKHHCLDVVEFSVPKNSSGYNITVKSVVKAANSISSHPKLEKIMVTDQNRTKLLSVLVAAQKDLQLEIKLDEERTLFEDLFYKVCVSPNGACVVSIRSNLTGRGWDNTVFKLRRPPPYAPSKLYPDLMDLDLPQSPPNKWLKDDSKKILKPVELETSGGIDDFLSSPSEDSPNELEIIDPRSLVLSDMAQKLFKNNKEVFIDIEGSATDPVEIALYGVEKNQYIHIFRLPKDSESFKKASRHSHGLIASDMADHINLFIDKNIKSMFSAIPKDQIVHCQGSDIKELLKFYGRSDINVADSKWKKKDYMSYHEGILDIVSDILPCKHSGTVKDKTGALTSPHCALVDCMMFACAAKGHITIEDPKPVQ